MPDDPDCGVTGNAFQAKARIARREAEEAAAKRQEDI